MNPFARVVCCLFSRSKILHAIIVDRRGVDRTKSTVHTYGTIQLQCNTAML
jgi:hypothetical protein